MQQQAAPSLHQEASALAQEAGVLSKGMARAGLAAQAQEAMQQFQALVDHDQQRALVEGMRRQLDACE